MTDSRRSASGARQAGDDFQHLVAWNRSLRALLPGRRAISVGLEALEAGNVDDVVVRFDQPPHEFTQVRYAVDASTPLDTDYLLATNAPGGTTMLQKFHTSWQRLSAGGDPQIKLVTNRAIDPADKVLTKVDGLTGLLVPALSQAEAGSELGAARAGWAAHIGEAEDELLAMLRCLRFRVGRPYEAEAEHAADLMAAAGLRNDAEAVRSGIDRMRRWVLGGNREVSLAELSDGIEELGLRVAEPAATLLIQTIDHDPQPDDATEALDWVALFEDVDPMARRQAVVPNAYSAMHDALQEAADRLIAAGHRRIVVRGPMRLASWFAAGAALPEVRGVHLRCGHRAQPWSSDEAGAGPVALDSTFAAEFGQGPDLAVALAFAADPTADVAQFIHGAGLPIGSLVRIAPPDGERIPSGAVAVAVAQAIKDDTRQRLRETGATHVHLFQSAPAGLSLLLGHRWNRMAPTTLWEDLGVAGYQHAFEVTS